MRGAASIEFAGAVIITAYVMAAVVRLVSLPSDLERVRSTVAEGVVFALTLDVAATLLKTVALHTWPQFGTFAIVFAIRTVVKRTLRGERRAR